MCVDPLSATILAGIGLAGSVVQGVGAYGESMARADTLNAQAAGKDRDIAANAEATAYEIARTRETVARTVGNQRAGFAANGIALSGSALDVINDTALEGDLDVAAIQWNSNVTSDNLKYEQKQLRRNASDAANSAPLAFLAPVLGGVAKFGGSFG